MLSVEPLLVVQLTAAAQRSLLCPTNELYANTRRFCGNVAVGTACVELDFWVDGSFREAQGRDSGLSGCKITPGMQQ
jgi:hypothetical protein